ncbi:hypothetical protein C8D70_101260 [Chryseobacterium sp. CBTAP 102]|uniref:hypothetical protein n=1 Tax=Chryseobacterium sp. CBTAP 102 TaxID=2135644 RepID=UPI000D76246D|nr:hypothetical protein [Chryseobacterium sp. CBTAP 102]PXW17934.1 hypothetical protein C8D70_101260 [Chryseobacterium sp. CBTAP 102]
MRNLLFITVFLFCSFQKSESPSGRSIRVENRVKKSERIIYFFFKAHKDSSGNEKITLHETKISDGKLKSTPFFDRNEVRKGDLIITVIEADGKEGARQLVRDPLNRELEVYEKEGISRHRASLQSAEFNIRFSYADNIQWVKVEKATDSGVQLLFTQKL